MSMPLNAPEDSGFPGGAYRANLYVYDPYGRIDWYAIAPQSFSEGKYFTLGRSSDCNISLADGSVSAHHAYIAAERGELFVRDLGSTNGVLVNDRKMAEAALRHGDVLRMGASDIRFLFSYREGPVQLVLDFLEGANAGRSLATYGSSTTIGRLNCAVNLHGQGLAPQHVRVDAYGPELMYVVNLRRENETRLNDAPVSGITTARDGDVLRIGEHTIRLRVVDADRAHEHEVPQGQGTLQLGEDSGLKAQAPVAQILISAADMKRLDAAHLARSGDDNTALEMFPPSDAIVSPTRERDQSRPVSVPSATPAPAPRASRSEPVAAARGERHPRVAGQAPGSLPPEPSRRRAIWPWLVALPLLMVVGALAALKLTHVHRELSLMGEIHPSQVWPMVAPVRGRLEKLTARIGERVAARDPLATLVDLDAEAELAGLTAQIEALQHQPAPVAVMVGGRVSPALGAALLRAESEVAAARVALDEAKAAFNRREVLHEAVESAQRALRARESALAEHQGAVSAAGEKRRVAAPVDPEAVARLGRLLSARDAAEKRLYVQVEAPRGGLVMALGGPTLRLGETVRREQPLVVIGEVSQVTARLRVPADALAEVEAAGKAILTLEGFKEPRVPVSFGKAGAAASADGTFALEITLDNPNGFFRPGLPARAEIELESVDALTFMLGGR
jgi:pSer/pThr/pTyr-binding forkhead associated (FHA) protein/multidrug resistance efflux pump